MLLSIYYLLRKLPDIEQDNYVPSVHVVVQQILDACACGDAEATWASIGFQGWMNEAPVHGRTSSPSCDQCLYICTRGPVSNLLALGHT